MASDRYFMKTLFSLALLLPSLLFAQEAPVPLVVPPQPVMMNPLQRRQMIANQGSQPGALPANYLLTLVLKDKDAVLSELAVTVATSRFQVGLGGQPVNFQGTLTLNDDGSAQVTYMLTIEMPKPSANNVPQFVSSTVESAARLQPGADPETIFRSGTQSVVLSVIKLPAGKGK